MRLKVALNKKVNADIQLFHLRPESQPDSLKRRNNGSYSVYRTGQMVINGKTYKVFYQRYRNLMYIEMGQDIYYFDVRNLQNANIQRDDLFLTTTTITLGGKSTQSKTGTRTVSNRSVKGTIGDKGREGKWTYVYNNGNLREVANYHHNIMVGEHTLHNEDGKVKEYENFDMTGKKHGVQISYVHTDKKSDIAHVIQYRHGKLHGEYRQKDAYTMTINNYEEDHLEGHQYAYDLATGVMKMHTFYKDGKAEGESKTWYADGTLKTECTYAKGKKEGVGREYHENKLLAKETNYVNDEEKGDVSIYFDSGVLKEKYTAHGWRKVGTYERYDQTGKLRRVECYDKRGEREGEWMSMDEDGTVTQHEFFKNGSRVDETAYLQHKLDKLFAEK